MKTTDIIRSRSLSLYLFLAFISTAVITDLSLSQPQPLEITVTTNKPSYGYRESVAIYGNVTYEGQLVEEGLVAIQVEDPKGKTISLRTVPAATVPSVSWTVEIVSIVSCDGSGNPKSDFNRESFAYFKATVRNNDINPRNVLVVINIYDIDLTPIGIAWEQTLLPPEGPTVFMPAIYVYGWVSTGSALACANVYTDWPKNMGYAHSPEKSTGFNIVTSNTLSYSSQSTIQDGGNYEGTFRIPPEEEPYSGTYSVSVSAFSGGWKAFQNTIFTVEYQVPADFDLNHEIEIYDVVRVTMIYGTKSGEPGWNPQVDLKPDGEIGIYDVVKVTRIYGTTY